jgi:hypothetical protein
MTAKELADALEVKPPFITDMRKVVGYHHLIRKKRSKSCYRVINTPSIFLMTLRLSVILTHASLLKTYHRQYGQKPRFES